MINLTWAELQYIKKLVLKDRVRIIKDRTVGMSEEERAKVVKDFSKVLIYPDGTYILPLESDAQWNILIEDRIEREMMRLTGKVVRGDPSDKE